MTSTLETPTAALEPTEPARYTTNRWNRVGLATLLIATAVMYLWNITINGMGNQFYAASAQAGSTNWESLLFGSLDPHNFITVDKPPVSQWVMGLSGQIFGFSSASMLIPQALMAVAAVALVYAAVTRISGPRTGLLAGAVLALTPVAALMFRFNNPDAVMVLLMTVAAYCTVRALQQGGAKWLAWAGVALGFAFLAKMLEGLMVAPALAAAYLVAAPASLRIRVRDVLVAAVALVGSAGWFVVLTLLWPASSRPYIAGSTDNNFMNLVLGYNGFARILGRNHNDFGFQEIVGAAAGAQLNVGGHGGFGGFNNQSQGLSRLFSGEFGFEIGWLIPAALLATVLVIVSRGRAPRTDLVRAAAILFGGWLVVDGLVLSFMHGMIHPYYCLSIAPAVAAMFAIGVHQMWIHREKWLYRGGLAATVLVTGVWSWWLLGRNADWFPSLRWVILAVTVVAAVALVSPRIVGSRRRIAIGALSAGLIGALAGPAAYTVATIGQAHQGGGPSVGPAQADRRGGFGMFGQSSDNKDLDAILKNTNTEWSAAISRSSSAAGLELATNTAVMAIGGFSGSDPVPTLSEFQDDVAQHKVAYYVIVSNKARGPGWGNRGHADITSWVTSTFTPKTVGDATVYDLSAPKKS